MQQSPPQPEEKVEAEEARPEPAVLPAGYRPAKSRVLRGVLLGIGWISVALGVLGIALPLLPTTPFLLLAAACFLRSSSEFHGWLLGHPYLGRYLEYYLGGQGMPFRAKVYTLAMLWSTMALSAWLVSNRWVSLILLITGLAVTMHMARLPTRKASPES